MAILTKKGSPLLWFISLSKSLSVAKWPALALSRLTDWLNMASTHKNKTVATLLAALLGGAGVHRFYLCGRRDGWAWLHFASLPLSALGIVAGTNLAPVYSIFLTAPLIVSALAGLLEALVLGLTPDAKWDLKYNAASGRHSTSTWPLALILALTLAVGMSALIFVMSRSFDLIFTGGAYG
jgi:TM2 domain-containing membrane protein YozV